MITKRQLLHLVINLQSRVDDLERAKLQATKVKQPRKSGWTAYKRKKQSEKIKAAWARRKTEQAFEYIWAQPHPSSSLELLPFRKAVKRPYVKSGKYSKKGVK